MIPANALAAVTSEELSSAATLYGSLKQLRLRMSNADENVLDRAFETHVQNVLDKLENRLPSFENPRVKAVEVAMARHGIFDASFQQAIQLCQHSKQYDEIYSHLNLSLNPSPLSFEIYIIVSPVLGDNLKELRAAHSRILAEMQRSVLEQVKDTKRVEADLASALETTSHLENEVEKLKNVVDLLDKVCVVLVCFIRLVLVVCFAESLFFLSIFFLCFFSSL